MPKPPLPKDKVKSVQLNVLFRQDEMEALKKQAIDAECRTLSEYIRTCIKHYEKCKRINPYFGL
jgi:hypothetical protein